MDRYTLCITTLITRENLGEKMKYSTLLIIALVSSVIFLTGCEEAEKAASKAKDASSSVVDSAKDMASDAADATKDAASSAVDATKDAASNAMGTAKEVGSDMTDAVKEKASDAVDSAKEMANDAMSKVTDNTADRLPASPYHPIMPKVTDNTADSKAVVDEAAADEKASNLLDEAKGAIDSLTK